MTLESSIIWLGKKQADIFINNNEAYLESLVTCVVPIKIMTNCYQILTRKGDLSHIEVWDKSSKLNVWETAKELSKGRLDRNQLIELVKALVTLEYFLQ